LPEALAREEGIEMALNAMRRARASDEVRELIEAREKAGHDWATRMEHAELEGLRKGLEKGRQEGQGRLLETARRMRQAGMTTEMILQVTGLPPEALDE
jgi:predicted transposase/invertase (TIGR01784 family)